jgi:hypothetical protein
MNFRRTADNTKPGTSQLIATSRASRVSMFVFLTLVAPQHLEASSPQRSVSEGVVEVGVIR